MAKKYYAVINPNGKFAITKNYSEFLELVFKKSVKCKGFREYNKALEWINIEVIKKTLKKFYAIYYPGENLKLILFGVIYLQKYINGKRNNLKSFNSLMKASEWLTAIDEIPAKAYFARYYITKKYGVIYFDEENRSIDKSENITKVFEDISQASYWLISNLKDKNQVFDIAKKNYKTMDTILEDSIYFDSGTGRGIGTEVNVTDYLGNSLLDKVRYDKLVITEYNTINIGNLDNSYGELYGLYLALKVALETGIKKIAGDNQGVLFRWSDGYYKKLFLLR